MKKIFIFTLCTITAFFITACGSNKKDADTTAPAGSTAQFSNPFMECATLEEAAGLVGFGILVPDTVNNFSDRIIRAMSDQMIEIIYQNGAKEIRIRKGTGSEDLSGDFTSYDTVTESTINDNAVTLKGNEGAYSLAIWSDGEYSFSIRLTDGVTQEEMTSIISEIE